MDRDWKGSLATIEASVSWKRGGAG